MPSVLGSPCDLSDAPIVVNCPSPGFQTSRKLHISRPVRGRDSRVHIEQSGGLVGSEEWRSNMAAITCAPDGKTIPLGPSETILEAVLRADIPHAHACGGRAKCSTCRIAILGGLENCSPRTETEQAYGALHGGYLRPRIPDRHWSALR